MQHSGVFVYRHGDGFSDGWNQYSFCLTVWEWMALCRLEKKTCRCVCCWDFKLVLEARWNSLKRIVILCHLLGHELKFYSSSKPLYHFYPCTAWLLCWFLFIQNIQLWRCDVCRDNGFTLLHASKKSKYHIFPPLPWQEPTCHITVPYLELCPARSLSLAVLLCDWSFHIPALSGSRKTE